MTQPLMALEDMALIEGTLAGKSEYFGVLMDRHMGALKRCVGAKVRDSSDADDLLQEAVLKIWRHLASFRAESSLRTWMTRVAINEVSQSYRRKRLRPDCQELGDFDAVASQTDCPQRSLARAQSIRTIRHAVARLPEKYKEVLILRDLNELTTRETAQHMKATIPAVKTRLLRARHLLGVALKRSESRRVRTNDSAGVI